MITLLAAEGGYQVFHLGGAEKTWLYICLVAGIVGIVVGLLLVRSVLAADQGTAKMKEIAKAIQEGAEAFLARQFRTIAIIIVPLAVLIFFTATKVVRPDGSRRPDLPQAGIYRVICFLVGAAFSGLTGFIGMSIAVRGNVRTAAAARERRACRRPSGWPSAPAPSPACSASASACSAPPSSCSSSRTRPPPSWSASPSAPRCSPCSCGSAAASSPRRPTWAPTWSARSRPASPRTTPATRPPSPTTWATTWATAPAWPPTSSSPT